MNDAGRLRRTDHGGLQFLMTSILRRRCCLVLGWLAAVGAVATAADYDLKRLTPVAATETIPVGDFFRSPLFQAPKLSPDGERFVALVETGSDHTGVFVYDFNEKKGRSALGPGDKDVYSVSWLNSDKLLMALSAEKSYAAALIVADAVNLRHNYPIENYNVTSLVGVPRKTPMRPLIWIRKNAYQDGRDDGVVQLDAARDLYRNQSALPGSSQYEERNRDEVYGTKAAIVASYPRPPGGMTISYLADKDNELAFAETVQDGVYKLYRYADGGWLPCPVDLDEITPVSHGDKPGELIVIGGRQEGKPRALLRLDAATGETVEVLCQDRVYDVDYCSVYTQPGTGVVLGVKFGRNRLQSIWFDRGYQAIQKMIDELFPGSVAQIMGSNEAQTRFFLAIYSDRRPVVYFSFDLATKKIEEIQNTEPWIDPRRMRPMNTMKVDTRDGFALEAYVTFPAGVSKKNPVPLVVLPHGGPWVRDFWGFDPEVQFLASRGYAVLQPNYRGSLGYGWRFPASDEWAFRKMHDDVTDSVKALIKTGLVDSSRIAIMGSSFGGYLAACGAAFEPELYRCAVSIAGVFDWQQVLGEARRNRFENARFQILLRHLGDKSEEFDDISPLRHVDQMKIPFLVAHGTADEVADIGESRALLEELEKYHVPHESFIARHEGHGMQRLSNQIELYSRIERFLDQYLHSTAAASAAGTH
jgi:dipeptidyl aminopeptidase/acylaminoacyl peptidase